MKLVREHINEKFTEEGDPIIDMGIGSPIYKILEHTTEGKIILSTIALYGDYEWMPSNVKLYANKDENERLVRTYFPFKSDKEFDNLKKYLNKTYSINWPGKYTQPVVDRFGTYKSFNFPYVFDESLDWRHLNYVSIDVTIRSYYIACGDSIYYISPGDTYNDAFKLVSDYVKKNYDKKIEQKLKGGVVKF
jgi:hypothetical protein